MTYLITAIAFIAIFSVLILIHEWGHYSMARKAKIKVEEFGFGLPPRMATLFKRGDTKFTLNWIPFGGFVRMHGEDDFSSKSQHDPDSFQSKSLLQRTLVIVAGVFMNYVLAVFLLGIGFSVGMAPILVSNEDVEQAIADGIIEIEQTVVVSKVNDGSPAAWAGLQSTDTVISVEGIEITDPEQIVALQQGKSEVDYLVKRGEEEVTVTVNPDEAGHIGVVLALQRVPIRIDKISYPVHQAFYEGFKEANRLSALTVYMLGNVVGKLVTEYEVPEGVAGPVGILQLTHHYAQEGLIALLQLCAVLSLSLAVINIMPFPALDGGRLLFIVFELVFRRRVNQKIEGYIHAFGFILLLLLIFLVTWQDILRWAGS